MQQRSKRTQFILDYLSGGVSGAISKTVCAPVERIKLLMQTANMNTKLNKPYAGIADCAIRCFKEDGILSMWRGNGVNVLRYFPTQALNFSFKDYFAGLFASTSSQGRILVNNIISGGSAGALTTLFVYPLDLARTRLGVDIGRTKNERQFNGLRDCLTKIYATNGVKSLYQGLPICILGIFVYRGLYFGIYDTGRDYIFKDMLQKFIVLKFFYAQAVVIFSETIRYSYIQIIKKINFSYPTDTIKRKLMMQSAGGDVKYTGAKDCFQKVVKSEGFIGLMRGNASNIVRSMGSSLCLVLYDEFKSMTRQNLTKQN